MYRPICALIAVAVAFFATEQTQTDATVEADPAGHSVVELNGHRFTLPRGFAIELVAKSPLVYRPVSAAFDERGRMYVTDSAGVSGPDAKETRPHRLVRLDPAQPDGRVLSGQILAETLRRPHGVMFRNGSCYVADASTILKFTDADDKNGAESREVWFDGTTLGHRELFGPRSGPDGWVFWTNGRRAAQVFRARLDGTGVEQVKSGGTGTPTGSHRYESTAFGETYCDNLFTARFDAAKVTRQVRNPDGSADSDFLVSDNCEFHPTDVTEDADGSLIVVDTGNWGHPFDPSAEPAKADVLGAIYRVKRVGSHKVRDPRGLMLDWQVGADELAMRLADERVAVRNRAVEQLGTAKPAEAVGPVAKVLAESPASRVRLAAVGAMCRLDHPDALAAIRKATTDKDATVRLAASAAENHFPSTNP